MGYAMVLFFDQPACRRVEDLQNGISQTAGLPATGNGRPRPHITLALFDTLETTDPANKILRSFSHSVFPFEIKMESVGCFPTEERVIFLAPVVTRPLLEVHEHLHRLLIREGLVSLPHYQPGKWVPHCTISTGLPPDSAARAMEEILHSDVFGCIALIEVGLVEFNPVKYLSAYPLVGNHATAA